MRLKYRLLLVGILLLILVVTGIPHQGTEQKTLPTNQNTEQEYIYLYYNLSDPTKVYTQNENDEFLEVNIGR